MNLSTLFAIALVLGLAPSCGTPGPPLPPSLELAQPVSDLRAARQGDAVTLTWTEPSQTTEKRNITRSQTVEICRSLTGMTRCGTPIASLPVGRNQARSQRGSLHTYTDHVTPESNSADSFFYAIAVVNPYGRSAGLSNQVTVPAAPALPPPSEFQAHLEADGVQLSWQAIAHPQPISGMTFLYRIYRRDVESGVETVAGEVPVAGDTSPSLLDTGFEWEKTYDFRALVVTQILTADTPERQVEGDATPSVRIVTRDIFPPATPSGLQAVFSGPGQKPSIDLVWSPDTEADLAGYNIYRHEAGSPPEKINQDLIKSSAYRDEKIISGHGYSYSVSAVDVRGNESPHSKEASEKVPASP